MDSEHGSLLKTRAENFARHLHTRLRSLTSDNTPWAAEDNNLNEVYSDIDSSLVSPQEELPEPIFFTDQQQSFPLQRDESSDSQYFDSVENIEDLSPVELTKIPILHMRTESKPISITNGHRNVRDVDSGCSRVHEVAPIDLNLGKVNNCDSTFKENSNSKNHSDNEELLISKNGEVVEMIRRNEDGVIPLEEAEEASETPKDSFCVFCDIEQIKSSLSNGCFETDGQTEALNGQLEETTFIDNIEFTKPPLNLDIEHISDIDKQTEFSNGLCEQATFKDNIDKLSIPFIENSMADLKEEVKNKNFSEINDQAKVLNGHSEERELKDNANKLSTSPSNSELKNEPFSDDNENVSLAELLQVLKQDIATETQNSEKNSCTTEILDNSQRECPDIQVHESSPVITTEPSHPEEDEDCDIETKRRSFRRCSSLKSGKTPPGTPGRKKIVRFADVLGLDLADVKTFLDEVPTIPKSAYEDLHGIDLSSSPLSESPLARMTAFTLKPEKILTPLFQQPSVNINFLDRVRSNNVCLESAYVSDPAFFAISGLVRVKNIDFHKSVYVRYSIDRWRSFSDLQARYVPNSCDGFSDKFTFVLYAHTLCPGQRVEFAIRFHTAGAQFWDNNGGSNYVFECINQLPPDPGVISSPMDTLASFY